MDLPLLTPPQVAEQVVEIPALELAVHLLIDDHRSHRPAEGRRGRVRGVRLVHLVSAILLVMSRCPPRASRPGSEQLAARPTAAPSGICIHLSDVEFRRVYRRRVPIAPRRS